MRYRTVVRDLLKDHPETYDRLCRTQKLLPTITLLANRLKVSHEFWMKYLATAGVPSNANRIAFDAAEIACEELALQLSAAAPPKDRHQNPPAISQGQDRRVPKSRCLILLSFRLLPEIAGTTASWS